MSSHLVPKSFRALSGCLLGLLAGVFGCEPAAPPPTTPSGGARAATTTLGLALPEHEMAPHEPGKEAVVVSARFLSAARGSLHGLSSSTADHVLQAERNEPR